MEIFIKIVQFFMSLSLLVAIHEFGHFIMARIFKIRVEKFYIFFDPWFSLFKWKRGDTEYGIGWLPLGGYVKIAGMIDESMDKEQMQAPPKPDEFRSKPAWQRFLVMIAGVTMNLILAFLIYTGICYTHGQSYMAAEDARWGYAFNDAAKDMGFRDGDKVVEIDGQRIEDVNDIRAMLLLTEGDRHVTIERDGRSEQFTIPFDKLLEMRRQKSYMDLYVLRLPFIVDSVASPSAAAAGLQAGDEVVACNGTANVDVPAITDILARSKGVTVTFDVKRGDERLDLIGALVAFLHGQNIGISRGGTLDHKGVGHGVQTCVNGIVGVDDGVVNVLQNIGDLRGLGLYDLDAIRIFDNVVLGGSDAGAVGELDDAVFLEQEQGTRFIGGVVGNSDLNGSGAVAIFGAAAGQGERGGKNECKSQCGQLDRMLFHRIDLLLLMVF